MAANFPKTIRDLLRRRSCVMPAVRAGCGRSSWVRDRHQNRDTQLRPLRGPGRALAVALGVGAAVAAMPSVAFADTTVRPVRPVRTTAPEKPDDPYEQAIRYPVRAGAFRQPREESSGSASTLTDGAGTRQNIRSNPH